MQKSPRLTDQSGLPLFVQQLQQRENRRISLAELKIVHGVDISGPALANADLPPRYECSSLALSSGESSPVVMKHRQHEYLALTLPPTPKISDLNTSLPDSTPASPIMLTGRKDWSAGMYLDFCLELQRSFDFNSFGTKYNIPVSKVFDRFQAIVLFPLMNESEKGKRRVVEGARARVKEWYDAKKETKKRLREEADEMKGNEE